MLSVFGETIDASTHQKMSVGIVCGAKQFIDIAFSVANVDASLGIRQ
jgi:hypothetical protein